MFDAQCKICLMQKLFNSYPKFHYCWAYLYVFVLEGKASTQRRKFFISLIGKSKDIQARMEWNKIIRGATFFGWPQLYVVY